LNLLFDDEAGAIEVDVAPGEPEQFEMPSSLPMKGPHGSHAT
jgi:hypothetical protein